MIECYDRRGEPITQDQWTRVIGERLATAEGGDVVSGLITVAHMALVGALPDVEHRQSGPVHYSTLRDDEGQQIIISGLFEQMADVLGRLVGPYQSSPNPPRGSAGLADPGSPEGAGSGSAPAALDLAALGRLARLCEMVRDRPGEYTYALSEDADDLAEICLHDLRRAMAALVADAPADPEPDDGYDDFVTGERIDPDTIRAIRGKRDGQRV